MQLDTEFQKRVDNDSVGLPCHRCAPVLFVKTGTPQTAYPLGLVWLWHSLVRGSYSSTSFKLAEMVAHQEAGEQRQRATSTSELDGNKVAPVVLSLSLAQRRSGQQLWTSSDSSRPQMFLAPSSHVSLSHSPSLPSQTQMKQSCAPMMSSFILPVTFLFTHVPWFNRLPIYAEYVDKLDISKVCGIIYSPRRLPKIA